SSVRVPGGMRSTATRCWHFAVPSITGPSIRCLRVINSGYGKRKNHRMLPMEGLKTPVSVIWHVLKARTEGMGFNAAARTFDKAKNTILAWEQKFVDLQRVVRRSSFCNIPIVDGKDSEEILGSAAYLSPKG